MPDQKDLKIIMAFTASYEELYEKEKITAQQRDRVLSLLDNFEDYSHPDVKEKIRDIFPENKL